MAEPVAALSTPEDSAKDARDLVRFLNATCAAGSCSGTYTDHAFSALACDAGTCTVTFAATAADGTRREGTVTVPSPPDAISPAGLADKALVANIGAAVAAWEGEHPAE